MLVLTPNKVERYYALAKSKKPTAIHRRCNTYQFGSRNHCLSGVPRRSEGRDATPALISLVSNVRAAQTNRSASYERLRKSRTGAKDY